MILTAGLIAGAILIYLAWFGGPTYGHSGGPIIHLSAKCVAGASGNANGDAYCVLSLNNTGTSETAVIGCTLNETQAKFGPGAAPPIVTPAAGVAIPAPTSSPKEIVCDGVALSQGAKVNGALALSEGFAPPFTAIAT